MQTEDGEVTFHLNHMINKKQSVIVGRHENLKKKHSLLEKKGNIQCEQLIHCVNSNH